MSATTRLTITASGSGASNTNGGNAGQSGEISVPNTGIINHADAPFCDWWHNFIRCSVANYL